MYTDYFHETLQVDLQHLLIEGHWIKSNAVQAQASENLKPYLSNSGFYATGSVRTVTLIHYCLFECAATWAETSAISMWSQCLPHSPQLTPISRYSLSFHYKVLMIFTEGSLTPPSLSALSFLNRYQFFSLHEQSVCVLLLTSAAHKNI